jgi:hypothetical protein
MAQWIRAAVRPGPRAPRPETLAARSPTCRGAPCSATPAAPVGDSERLRARPAPTQRAATLTRAATNGLGPAGGLRTQRPLRGAWNEHARGAMGAVSRRPRCRVRGNHPAPMSGSRHRVPGPTQGRVHATCAAARAGLDGPRGYRPHTPAVARSEHAQSRPSALTASPRTGSCGTGAASGRVQALGRQHAAAGQPPPPDCTRIIPSPPRA